MPRICVHLNPSSDLHVALFRAHSCGFFFCVQEYPDARIGNFIETCVLRFQETNQSIQYGQMITAKCRRQMMKRGLVLEGGGAKGAYQFGCLLALAEHGIQVDAIAGTSVGALNGALVAYDRLAEGREYW